MQGPAASPPDSTLLLSKSHCAAKPSSNFSFLLLLDTPAASDPADRFLLLEAVFLSGQHSWLPPPHWLSPSLFLSVFPFPSEMPASAKEAGIHPKERFLPVTVISDGQLLHQNLQYAAKDEAWVHKVLGQYRASIAGTWLLTVDKADRVLWLGKE